MTSVAGSVVNLRQRRRKDKALEITINNISYLFIDLIKFCDNSALRTSKKWNSWYVSQGGWGEIYINILI